ncbi:MAG: imidazole glycerol phosphate synthase subunit HisH [Hyphomicrobiales bacterium]|nr:MAG: imidazole glycerol phosphate synthase subunit HisH [Hyphomicrobiales bacterium]
MEAETRRFQPPAGSRLKVPHMGWNEARPTRLHPLFDCFQEKPRFYFVHSYYMATDRPETVLAETEYGQAFASAIVRDNMAGVQFHPEKSHRFGMTMLHAFATKRGSDAS